MGTQVKAKTQRKASSLPPLPPPKHPFFYNLHDLSHSRKCDYDPCNPYNPLEGNNIFISNPDTNFYRLAHFGAISVRVNVQSSDDKTPHSVYVLYDGIWYNVDSPCALRCNCPGAGCLYSTNTLFCSEVNKLFSPLVLPTLKVMNAVQVFEEACGANTATARIIFEAHHKQLYEGSYEEFNRPEVIEAMEKTSALSVNVTEQKKERDIAVRNFVATLKKNIRELRNPPVKYVPCFTSLEYTKIWGDNKKN